MLLAEAPLALGYYLLLSWHDPIMAGETLSSPASVSTIL